MNIKKRLTLFLMVPLVLGVTLCSAAQPQEAQTVLELLEPLNSVKELNEFETLRKFKELSQQRAYEGQEAAILNKIKGLGDLGEVTPHALFLLENGIGIGAFRAAMGATPLQLAVMFHNLEIPSAYRRSNFEFWVVKRIPYLLDAWKTEDDQPVELLKTLIATFPQNKSISSELVKVFKLLLNEANLAEDTDEVMQAVNQIDAGTDATKKRYKDNLINELVTAISAQKQPEKVNVQDEQGQTLMHALALSEDISFQRFQDVATHADLSIKDKAGKTSLDLLLELWNQNKPARSDEDHVKRKKLSRLLALMILIEKGVEPSDKSQLDPLLKDIFTFYGTTASSKAKQYVLSAENEDIKVLPLLDIAQRLIDKGADVEKIKTSFFQQYSHSVARTLQDDASKDAFNAFVKRHTISDIHESYQLLLKPSEPEPSGPGGSGSGSGGTDPGQSDKDESTRKIKPIHVVAGGAAAVGLVGAAVYAWKWYKKRQKEKALAAERARKKREKAKKHMNN